MQPVSRPTRRGDVERPLREDLAEERPRGCEHRHDLDPGSPKLRLYQGERLRSKRNSGARHEAQREPLAAAGEDPVRSSAAAGLPEQAAGLRRSIAVGAPVRLVVAALGQVHGAVERASGGIDLAPYLSDERGAVDPVRERAANELVAERRVSVRSELDGELLEIGGLRARPTASPAAAERPGRPMVERPSRRRARRSSAPRWDR